MEKGLSPSSLALPSHDRPAKLSSSDHSGDVTCKKQKPHDQGAKRQASRTPDPVRTGNDLPGISFHTHRKEVWS